MSQRLSIWRKLLPVVAALGIVAAVVVSLSVWATSAIKEGQSVREAIAECTTPPTTPDDPHECAEWGERNRATAVLEIDCRNRRAVAGLPAPPHPPIDTPVPLLARWCRDLTPPEIYPGTPRETP